MTLNTTELMSQACQMECYTSFELYALESFHTWLCMNPASNMPDDYIYEFRCILWHVCKDQSSTSNLIFIETHGHVAPDIKHAFSLMY